MSLEDIYIGIDYSLKSPAVCIFKNSSYKWLSHPKALDKKSEFKYQQQISLLDDVELVFQSEQQTSDEYSKNEYAKIMHYRNQAVVILDMISRKISERERKESRVHIGFEGYSFESTSNNLIDIVGATTLVKALIIERNIFADFTLDVYSPKAIKKLAGYGSYDKTDLFDVFTGNYNHIKEKYKLQISKDKKDRFKLNYHDKFLSGQFHNYCSNLNLNRESKKVKIPKPIDDLIDSYFIVRRLYEDYSKNSTN